MTARMLSQDCTMPSQNDYLPVFCFEGLITEFGKNYLTVFFPGGLFLNLVIITDRFFPQEVPFSSQVKNA